LHAKQNTDLVYNLPRSVFVHFAGLPERRGQKEKAPGSFDSRRKLVMAVAAGSRRREFESSRRSLLFPATINF
jgi:hypothetical protein